MTFLGSKIYIKIVLGLAVLLLGLNSCKPEEEPFDNQIGDPVFSLKGTIDGKPIELIAGVNDYYMFTEHEVPQNDSIIRFKGRLAKANCQNCGEALEIILGNSDVVTGGNAVDMNRALSSTFSYANQSAIAAKNYTIPFIAEDSGYTNPRYFWTFGTAFDSSTSANPTITFRDSFPKNICLTISDGNCARTICNTLNPFLVDLGDSIPPSFDYTVGSTVIFRNSSFGRSYLWDFGDGNTSTAYSPEHIYNAPGIYRVCLTVNTIVNSHTYCKDIVVNFPPFRCLANMRYGKPAVSIIRENFISKAAICYRANDSTLYESNLQQQLPGSFFTINNFQRYQLNEKGDKTQWLNLSFKCRLFNVNNPNDFKDIEITNGTIAVAHP